jgi:hypothetical protein
VPRIVFLKDGYFYKDVAMREAYHLVHEFVEVGLKKTPAEKMVSVTGRATVVGQYLNYIIKELAYTQ